MYPVVGIGAKEKCLLSAWASLGRKHTLGEQRSAEVRVRNGCGWKKPAS